MLAPVYERDGITLYHGDCLDILPLLLVTVDAVLADLPYGTTRNRWDKAIDNKRMWAGLHGLMGPRTPACLFGTGMFSAELVVSNRGEFRYDLIWDKVTSTGFLNAKKQPLRGHENIHVFYRKQPHYDPQLVYTGRSSHSRGTKTERTISHWGEFKNTPVADQPDGYQHPRSVLTYPRPKGKDLHESAKPVALMEWLVRSYTAPGDLVLDQSCGSGTTLVAARTAGRRAVGIELDPASIDKTITRLESGSEGDHW